MDTTDYSEMLPVVNEQGEVTGKTTRKEAHGKLRPLHPVVHLHVFNSRGELYLQKRPQWKDVQPGKWDTATGGHVGYGESIENALVREVAEELGITGFAPVFLGRYTFESNVERELVHVFRTAVRRPGNTRRQRTGRRALLVGRRDSRSHGERCADPKF